MSGSEVYVSLDQDDFRALIRGQAVTLTDRGPARSTIRITLRDIGWTVMLDEISNAAAEASHHRRPPLSINPNAPFSDDPARRGEVEEERCVGCGRLPSEGIGCSSCPGYNSQGYPREFGEEDDDDSR
jgi:hypothetical protein